jgi:hypothetical protein
MMKKNLGENEFIDHVYKISKYMKVQRLEHFARTLQANGSGNGKHPETDEDIV